MLWNKKKIEYMCNIITELKAEKWTLYPLNNEDESLRCLQQMQKLPFISYMFDNFYSCTALHIYCTLVSLI